MLFTVIGKYRRGPPIPVYRWPARGGRPDPTGVAYRGSRVAEKLARRGEIEKYCGRSALEKWMASWADLPGFEVTRVMTSASAQGAVASRRG